MASRALHHAGPTSEPVTGNVSAFTTGAPVMAVIATGALVEAPNVLVTTTRCAMGEPGVKLLVSTTRLALVAPEMAVNVTPPEPLSDCH